MAKSLRMEHVIFEQLHKVAVTSVRPPDARGAISIICRHT